MTASRDFLCPSGIVLLAFLHIWPCVATPTQDSGTNFVPSEPLDLPDNYYNEYEDPIVVAKPTPKTRIDLQTCDYDVCLEEKAPCSALAALTGCLCPGVTLEAVTPEAPAITALTPEGSTGVVVVRWCAPYSLVTTYGIRVVKRETVTVGSSRRSGRLEGLNDGDKVCVFAENASGEGPESCMTYKSEESKVSLRAVIIGGALGLVLLAVLAVLLWKYTQRRKSGTRISTQDRADSQQAYPDSDRVTLDVL